MAIEDTAPLIIHPGDGEAIWMVGDRIRVLVSGKHTNQAFALIETEVFPGGGPPPHRHLRESETFYILEGSLTVVIEEHTSVAEAGSCVHIPPGHVHTFHNHGSVSARMLVFLTPAGFENYFQAVGIPADSTSPHPPQVTPTLLEALITHAPAHHLEFVHPTDS